MKEDRVLGLFVVQSLCSPGPRVGVAELKGDVTSKNALRRNVVLIFARHGEKNTDSKRIHCVWLRDPCLK